MWFTSDNAGPAAPPDFDAQCAWLSENGYYYPSWQELRAYVEGTHSLPAKSVILTFDDGEHGFLDNGIPILDPGATAAGVQILPQNETQGSSSAASSIYAVKFGQDEGDQAVTGLTNGGVSVRDLGEVDDKPVFRTRVEFYCGLATFGGKAAARLRGVLAS